MGVIVGRFGKVEEGLLERGKNKLAGMVKRFAASAENYGLAIADREIDGRKGFSGNNIVADLESYGVATCEAGTSFWKQNRA